jgi:predicted metal-dependent peptidase
MKANVKKQALRVQAARTALVLDQPFFGVLALRLHVKPDPTCKTLWVDGVTLGWSPEYVADLSAAELKGAIAHEVMHCALGHPWRRGARNFQEWNEACDYATNPILEQSGFTLPKGVLLDPSFEGKGAEWIYDRLGKGDEGGDEPSGDSGGDSGEAGGAGSGEAGDNDDSDGDDSGESGGDSEDGDGSDDAGGDSEDSDGDGSDESGNSDGDGPDESQGEESYDSPQGEVRDAPAGSSEEGGTEADWKAAVQQAANAAAAQGRLPGHLERFAKEQAESKVDWRSALRRFVQEAASADYSWRRPSARYVARGLYMPALHSEALGPIVVAIDTSMSIDDVTLSKFAAEVRAVVDEADPEGIHVMYCDSKLHRTDWFDRNDLAAFESLDPVGGGGTSFVPVFDALDDLEQQPCAVIYLTDLAGRFPEVEPEIPTLWASTVRYGHAPFGEVLPIDA